MNSDTSSESSTTGTPGISYEMLARAKKHYESAGKRLNAETDLIGPWTPLEMQDDRPSGGWADRPQGGESCCPRQSPNAKGKHEFWICSSCYYDRFASNARQVDFEKAFQAGFGQTKTKKGDPLPEFMMDDVLAALKEITDTGSSETGANTSEATGSEPTVRTAQSDSGSHKSETL